MLLDLWLTALVLILGIGGMTRGASAQLAKLLALAVATGLGLLAGLFLGPRTGGTLRLAPALRTVGWAIAVGLVAYLLLSPLLVALARRLVARGAFGRVDRVLGFFVGAVRGAYLAWVILLALPISNRALALAGSHWRIRTEGSRLGALAAAHAPTKRGEEAELRAILDRFSWLHLPGQ
ncbi:MAG: CvpA family protein [Deltaproteobacteria bacterium]